uniref:Uncharacterized protein n=1 Tax=Arundo donax TaxID=35708 RepID=A0A0A8Z2Y8_ARUDO
MIFGTLPSTVRYKHYLP